MSGKLKTYTSVQPFITAKNTNDRLASQPKFELTSNADGELPAVMVDVGRRFQTIEGFGGAFTEAAAITCRKMSPENQQRILKAYFDRHEGHGYSLCRTHINSCDFSTGNYAYTEVDGKHLDKLKRIHGTRTA